MAQTLARKTLTLFGGSGGTSNFGQFGSQAASAPLETKDIITIQSLTAWIDGWQDAVALGQAPYLQDMNGVMYVHSYEQCYMLTEGIPEWDSGTTYNWGSVVKLPYTGGNNFQIFVSLADANTANALPTAPASNAHWQFVMGFISGVFTMGTSLAFGSTSTEGIVGTVTNDSAATGNVGEYMSAKVLLGAAINAGAARAYVNIATLSLTAGDWDVDGIIASTLNGSNANEMDGVISLFSGNTQTDHVQGDNSIEGPPPTSAYDAAVTVAGYRISLAAPATVYLKASVNFNTGQAKIYGRISARRVR